MVNSGITVILVNPPTRDGSLVIREGRCEQSGGLWATVWPPLTLATVAAYLENDGHDVAIYDCPVQHIAEQEFLSILGDKVPGLVVLNVSTPTLDHDLSYPEKIKSILPNTMIATIGAHVTAFADDVLQSCPALDMVVMGEPEVTILDSADRIRSGVSLADLPGGVVRDGDTVRRNPLRSKIDDLDALPVPAWHLLDLNRYQLPVYNRPFLMVSSGRGCPFGCTFCAAQTYYGAKLRLRSPESVAGEMFAIQDRFGVSDFLFWTESFTLAKDQVRRLCDILIEAKRGLRWTCNSRVDVIDYHTLSKMKDAGCWMVSFGIESASQDVLDRAGKKIWINDVFRAVRTARKAGLQTTGHFILGLPGETPESLRMTSRLARRLDVDFAQFYCAVPFPGSELYNEAHLRGWIRNPEWSQFDQTVSNMDLPGLNAADVQKARRHAIRSFYLRPRNIYRTLIRVRSIKEIKSLFTMFFEFLRSM